MCRATSLLTIALAAALSCSGSSIEEVPPPTAPCTTRGDCPADPAACGSWACQAGACELEPATQGTPCVTPFKADGVCVDTACACSPEELVALRGLCPGGAAAAWSGLHVGAHGAGDASDAPPACARERLVLCNGLYETFCCLAAGEVPRPCTGDAECKSALAPILDGLSSTACDSGECVIARPLSYY